MIIDWTQPTYDILMDIINNENNTSLDATSFTFSDPSVHSDPTNGSVNTVVTLTAAVNSGMYGSREIYYNRQSITDAIQTQTQVLDPITETKLSEIIEQINTQYGLHLKTEDYYDTDLPTIDANYPNRLRQIALVIKPTSYFYTGIFTFTLGPLTDNTVPDDDTVTRHFYLHMNGLPLEEVRDSFVSLNSDLTHYSLFSFLNNVSAITQFDVWRVLQNSTGNFIFSGVFSLTFTDEYSEVITVTGVNTLFINALGSVLDGIDTELSDDVNLTIQHPKHPWHYSWSSSIVNHLRKYTEEGIRDISFATPLGYAIGAVRLDSFGRIYVASIPFRAIDPYNPGSNVSQVRIERLLETGARDATFSTIVIRSSLVTADAFDVLDMTVNDDSLYVALKPTYGVDIAAINPVINNVLTVQSTVGNTTYSWNPVFKFYLDGTRDVDYSNLQDYYKDTALLTSVANMNRNDRILHSLNDEVTFLTERINPITGFNHKQPITFDRTGKMVLSAGGVYQYQIKWTQLKNIYSLSNDLLYAVGVGQKPMIAGNYSTPDQTFVIQKKDGEVKQMLTVADLTSNVTDPVIFDYVGVHEVSVAP